MACDQQVASKPHDLTTLKEAKHYPVIIELSDRIPIAKNAGIRIGDQIVSIDGIAIPTSEEAIRVIHLHKNNSVKMVVSRNQAAMPVTVAVSADGKIGVRISDENDAIVSAQENDHAPIFKTPAELEKTCELARTDHSKYLRDLANQALLKTGTHVKVLYEEQHLIGKQPIWICNIRLEKPGASDKTNPAMAGDWLIVSTCLSPSNGARTHIAQQVTRKQTQALKADMSTAEVVKLLGATGTELAHNSYHTIDSKALKWQNADSSFVTCNFENDRLTYVSAFLLK